jgi:GxxExxY protein
MGADEITLNDLSRYVIGCAMTVSNTLVSDFAEKVYENALAHELRKDGHSVVRQRGVTVWYDGVMVGEYNVDLLVDDALLIELKAIKALDNSHRAQCLNYLRATGLRLCLLINFGSPRLEFNRIVNRL